MNGWSYVQTDTMSGWIRSDVITGKKPLQRLIILVHQTLLEIRIIQIVQITLTMLVVIKVIQLIVIRQLQMIIKVILIQVNNILKKQCILMIHT